MPSVVHKYVIDPKESIFTYQNKIVTLSPDSSGCGEDKKAPPSTQLKTADPFKTKMRRLRAFIHGGGSRFKEEPPTRCVDNLCFFGDALYLMTDASLTHQIDPETLESVSQVSVDSLAPVLIWCSHPHIEADGVVWNVGISHDGNRFAYSILRFPYRTSSELLAEIPCRRKASPCYIHSFAMTDKHIIVIEQPLFIDKTATSGDNLHHHLKWRQHLPVHFYVVEKSTGNQWPTTFECDPFFFFHVINAFEKEGGIVIDLIAYKDADIVKDLRFCHIEKTDHVPSAGPVRIFLPRHNTSQEPERSASTVVHSEPLVPEPMDFPRFNYDYMGKQHQYFYAVGNELLHPNKIYKVDLSSRDILTWREPGFYVSEAVFVARPGACLEDDGVLLLTMLCSASQNAVYLVILDANNMVEMARILFSTEGSVAQPMHGLFVFKNSNCHKLPQIKY